MSIFDRIITYVCGKPFLPPGILEYHNLKAAIQPDGRILAWIDNFVHDKGQWDSHHTFMSQQEYDTMMTTLGRVENMHITCPEYLDDFTRNDLLK